MTQSGKPHWQQRITSALTLAVYADSLSAEFAVPGHAVVQMFTLAGHLASGGVEEDALAAELAASAWPQAENAVLSGTQQILTAIAAGAAWWEAAPAYRDGEGCWGSDAAVRSGVAGLLQGASIGAVAQLARRSAAVTHTNPGARDACAVHAAAVAVCAAADDFDEVDPDKVLAVLAGLCRGATMRAQLHLVRRVTRDRCTPEEAASVLGSGRSAVGAVSAALAAHLICPRDPLEAIAWAREMGPAWHAATVMTATVGGARNPHARPPLTWVLRPALRAQISAAAVRLAAASPPVMRHYRTAAAR